MKHTRIFWSILLVLAILSGTVGCGGNANSTVDTEQQGSTGSSAATEPSQTVEAMATQTVPTTEPEPTEPFVPDWMVFSEDRVITARDYFVYDLNAGVYLHASGPEDTVIYPASITKLYSAYVVLQYLSPDHVITAGSELELIDPDSSVAGLEAGDPLTVAQLVQAMLLPSGNDATYVLAAATGRVLLGNANAEPADAVNAFVAEMNRMAPEVGLTGSHFVTPDGIHDEAHYLTFRDLVTLTKLVINTPTIKTYAAACELTVTLSNGNELEWHNTNALINPESDYYCPYAMGLKTGQTNAAGSCLLSYFEFNGRKLVVGVFGCESSELRFEDSLHLFNEAIGVQ